MKFKQFLIENDEKKLAAKVAAVVDDFTGDVTCDTTDRKVCHMAVGKIQQGGHALVLGKYRFHGEMKFMMWDESKWSKLGEYIRNDKTSKELRLEFSKN